MSLTKGRELDSWQVVLARLRRTETTWRGNPLSKVDHETYTEAILLCALVLNDLSNQYEGCGTKRDHVLWAHNCAHTDVAELASFLPDAIVAFRLWSSEPGSPQYASYETFKQSLGKNHPRVGMLLAPVGEAIQLYASDPTPARFYPVYQFLSFLTHLSLQNINMSEELEAEYKWNEELIRQHHLPGWFIDEMNHIMVGWLKDFKIESKDFVPKHGPGAVAEFDGDKSLYSKYSVLSTDALIDYVFLKHAGTHAQTFVPFRGVVPTTRRSKIVFVPKSMKTKRVISKEPATLMYYQQGVWSLIRKYVRQHPYLSERIDFNDQDFQRDYALEASRTREHATVDLSAASDSVSWDLVKRVFHGTTLYPFLVALRSQSTELPSGEVVGMAKFAPMGSALCFPIESLIFACIAECTVRYCRSVTGNSVVSYRVYGDDIIIPDHCLYDLRVNLRWCGFRINESKTYGGINRFRESCGCDAYDGVDVSPLRISRNFVAGRIHALSPNIFQGTIDLANQAFNRKYLLLRRYLVDKLINGNNYLPLFSEDDNHGLISPMPDNYRAERIWSSELRSSSRDFDYQIWYIKVAYPRSVQGLLGPVHYNRHRKAFVESKDTVPAHADFVRYFEWLRITSDRDGDLFDPAHRVEVSVGSAGDTLSRQWIGDPL